MASQHCTALDHDIKQAGVTVGITSFICVGFCTISTEFDRVVQESREQAKQAAQLIPEIEDNIHKAETSTYSALAALFDADNYASAAEELALAAQNTSSSILVVRNVATY